MWTRRALSLQRNNAYFSFVSPQIDDRAKNKMKFCPQQTTDRVPALPFCLLGTQGVERSPRSAKRPFRVTVTLQ